MGEEGKGGEGRGTLTSLLLAHFVHSFLPSPTLPLSLPASSDACHTGYFTFADIGVQRWLVRINPSGLLSYRTLEIEIK